MKSKNNHKNFDKYILSAIIILSLIAMIGCASGPNSPAKDNNILPAASNICTQDLAAKPLSDTLFFNSPTRELSFPNASWILYSNYSNTTAGKISVECRTGTAQGENINHYYCITIRNIDKKIAPDGTIISDATQYRLDLILAKEGNLTRLETLSDIEYWQALKVLNATCDNYKDVKSG